MYPAGAPHGDARLPVDTSKIVGGAKLHGEMRDLIRHGHYCIRTAQAHLDWANLFIRPDPEGHLSEMGQPQILAFLSHLAVKRKVVASTPSDTLDPLVLF